MKKKSQHEEAKPSVDNFSALLRPREVAKMRNVSPSEVSRLVKARALPFYRFGTSVRKRGRLRVTVERVRFSKAAVLEFLKKRLVEGGD